MDALVPASSITVVDRADEAPALVYLARLAAGSRPTQAQALRVIADIARPGADPLSFPWHRLEYQHTQAIRTVLAERYSPRTANRMLSALRGVLREAWRLELMPAEQKERACDLQPIRGTSLPAGRGLASMELLALFRSCDTTPAGVRDAALLAVLYAGGLRRSEVVALDLADWDERERSLKIRNGKGAKDRLVFIADTAADRLNLYVAIRGRDAGALFVRLDRGRHLEPGQRLSRQAVRHILLQRCKLAQVAPCSPHDMRRSFISDLLDAGADISSVQQLAGHASVTTTQRYDRRGDRAKRAAAQRLFVP
jgi:site-specific recombinase XerD